MKTRAAVLRKAGTTLVGGHEGSGVVCGKCRCCSTGKQNLCDAGKWAGVGCLTRAYTLDEINEGYQDLMDGKNIRGVIVHQH